MKTFDIPSDAKIALAMRDSSVRKEMFPYIFERVVQDGYRSRPEDVSLALDRLRKEMPMAFEEENQAPLSEFQRFQQRTKGAV